MIAGDLIRENARAVANGSTLVIRGIKSIRFWELCPATSRWSDRWYPRKMGENRAEGRNCERTNCNSRQHPSGWTNSYGRGRSLTESSRWGLGAGSWLRFCSEPTGEDCAWELFGVGQPQRLLAVCSPPGFARPREIEYSMAKPGSKQDLKILGGGSTAGPPGQFQRLVWNI